MLGRRWARRGIIRAPPERHLTPVSDPTPVGLALGGRFFSPVVGHNGSAGDNRRYCGVPLERQAECAVETAEGAQSLRQSSPLLPAWHHEPGGPGTKVGSEGVDRAKRSPLY